MQLNRAGFTLIELSIVLVIIGLIVGGILTGQSLISAAAARAQIAQIEKYQTAAATFQGKYGYLPGDITATAAAQFGFASRGQYAGQGDGNGKIEGVMGNCSSCNSGTWLDAGETAMFWVDLSAAHLIDGGFNTANSTTQPGTIPSGTAINYWLPQAKIGGGNYVYAWSCGTNDDCLSVGTNYFGVSVITVLPNNATGTSERGITVAQAYSIDKKIDDGLPTSGNVLAYYVWSESATGNNSEGYWAEPFFILRLYGWAVPTSSTYCFDNNNQSGVSPTYSLAQNNGAGVNCALSFKMQAGD